MPPEKIVVYSPLIGGSRNHVEDLPMSSKEIVIDVRNLSKRYEIYNTPRDRLKQLVLPRLHQTANRAGVALKLSKHRAPPSYFREFWALNDVSFQVRRGETFGIIGRNGSGKSTLLQILAGTLAQTSGEVSVKGRIAALLELGSGFDPEFSGRENVFLNGRILGLTQKEIEARYDQIVEFADIGEFIDQPVKTYSSGMFVRLAFAVQAHIDASIVIIDEALAVGDVFFRQKCYSRLEQLRNSGAAILLVSHSMPEIEQYCERAILLDHGIQRFIGSSSEAAKHYYLLHQTKTQVVDNQPIQTASRSAPDSISQVIVRPPPDAFIDLTNKSQISNGQARCIGLALCSDDGYPCNNFQQGQVAIFYSEFEILSVSGVPICGLTLRNDKGVIVHGKNTLQFPIEVQIIKGSKSKVICHQKVYLNIAPGEYTFQIGISCMSESEWNSRDLMSHEEIFTSEQRLCHIPAAGAFSVRMQSKNMKSYLLHHGIADLPGTQKLEIYAE
jgi:lipopolysaccharide transport system ATP-binding protein